MAMKVSEQLRTKGRVSRGKLGIGIQEVTPELAASFNLKEEKGALVSSIEKDSPAEKAGLQIGDVILKFEGREVKSSRELPLMVGETAPGIKARLQIWRKGESREVTLVVGEQQSDKARGSAAEQGKGDKLGLVLGNLSDEKRKALGISHGLLVEKAAGDAARAGIRPGDVIVGVNNQPVESQEQFSSATASLKKGQTVAILIRRGQSTIFVPVKISGEQ
jgi:serine protease Do